MQRAWPRGFWWTAFAQALVLFGVLGGWFFIKTRAYLAAPPDGDLYAHTWSYQALAFFITYGAVALLFLVVLISLELIAWSWFTSRRENVEAGQGNADIATKIENRAP